MRFHLSVRRDLLMPGPSSTVTSGQEPLGAPSLGIFRPKLPEPPDISSQNAVDSPECSPSPKAPNSTESVSGAAAPGPSEESEPPPPPTVVPVAPPVPPVAQPPTTKKQGFSIEEIMRR